jgi:hypothetical protein
MRKAYAHEALVEMSATADPDAIGAAVTVALCGEWMHEPPCPLAPHHTQAARTEDRVRVRTLFVAEPSLEREVRRRIDRALANGTQQTPIGATVRWQLVTSAEDAVREVEREHAERLIGS